MAVQIAVCGPAECTPGAYDLAYRVGELLAAAGAVVICGGGGVMAAAAAGARSRGGLAIGVRPDRDRHDPSGDLGAVIATGMGQARNTIIVTSADAVIAVGGSWGTLSEIAHAIRGGTPVVVLDGWRIRDGGGRPVPGPVTARTPEQAVELALAAA